MSFYKMDPAAWDHGTANLTLEQEAALLRIVNSMQKNMRPVPNNARVLAGMFRCSTRKARSLVNALIAVGKLHIEGEDIVNDRASSDMVQRWFVSSSRAEVGAKGGRTRAELAANPLISNDTPQAIASPREEKRREESSEANASAADGVVDFAKAIFDNGVAMLARSGMPEASARSFVGKLRQTHGDREIFDAFAAFNKSGATDPKSWLMARLGPQPRASPGGLDDETMRLFNEKLAAQEARRAAK